MKCMASNKNFQPEKWERSRLSLQQEFLQGASIFLVLTGEAALECTLVAGKGNSRT